MDFNGTIYVKEVTLSSPVKIIWWANSSSAWTPRNRSFHRHFSQLRQWPPTTLPLIYFYPHPKLPWARRPWPNRCHLCRRTRMIASGSFHPAMTPCWRTPAWTPEVQWLHCHRNRPMRIFSYILPIQLFLRTYRQIPSATHHTAKGHHRWHPVTWKGPQVSFTLDRWLDCWPWGTALPVAASMTRWIFAYS